MARIAFIGLGNMGLPMAINLIKAGHQVEGVDVNPASVAKLKDAGGAPVEFAHVAAARADAVITMLPAGQHVREVYLGPNGIVSAANPGTLLIDCSTIDVESARAVAAEAEKKGLFMVDANFGGGNVALQQQSPSGAWLPLNTEGTATPISLTANGVANFAAPAGQIRAVSTTATAVNAYAVGVPTNNGG